MGDVEVEVVGPDAGGEEVGHIFFVGSQRSASSVSSAVLRGTSFVSIAFQTVAGFRLW